MLIDQQTTANPSPTILKVITVKNSPFVNYFNDVYTHSTNSDGYGPGLVMDILHEVAQQYNWKYEVTFANESLHDRVISSTAEVNSFFEKETFDIFAEALIARSDAYPGIELSVPFMLSETAMLIRSPDYYQDNTLMMMTPFSCAIWGIIAATILLSGVSWYGFTKMLSKVAEVRYNFVDSIWVFYSVFLQQGLPVLPRTWTCRSLLALWWLVSLTLWATFTGNMLLMFSMHRSKLPFDSLEEMVWLLQKGTYKIVTDSNSLWLISFIRNSVLESYRHLWQEMNQNGRWLNVSSFEKGRDLVVAHKNIILIGPKLNLEILAASDCRVTVVTGGMMQLWYSIGFPLNSPYASAVSETIQILVEQGIIPKLLNNYCFAMTKQSPRCQFREGVSAASGHPVNLDQAQGAFWLFLAGVALAFLLFLAEQSCRYVHVLSNWLAPFGRVRVIPTVRV